jgi:hypothetical protein
MIRSKRCPWAFALLLVSMALSGVLGCGRTPPSSRVAASKSQGEDPLDSARDILRKATAAPTFRDALHLVNAHLARDAEASARLQKIKEDRERALPPDRLREHFGLDPDEVEEIGATTFRPLDAYYLAQAFELRDAARALPIQQDPPLRQAELVFQWVMRQVLLCEREAELLPPEFVLHDGQGTALERALVFLSVLNQLNLEGCMIAVPGASPAQPRFWAPGVLIEDKGRRDIYLFDTRLGLPIPGPAGKGIATFAQVRKQPDLLQPLTVDQQTPYDITPDQARAAEIYLVCPLSAMAPRMKFLEEVLAGFDRVNLAIDPPSLLDRFKAASQSEVRIWNQPSSPGKPPPNTPTRALRLFVPANEGGLDKTLKAQRYLQRTIPLAPVTRALREMRLGEELPAPAGQELRKFATILYAKYALAPHDYLLRGRLAETTKRLVQTLSLVREFEEARAPEADFLPEVAQWRERAKDRYLNVIRQAPGAQKALDAFWIEDLHLLALMGPANEESERQKLAKRTLSFIVMRSVANPMRNDASYLLALCWQEKAERFQAQRDGQAGKDDARTAKPALDAWLNVEDWWQKYATQYPFNPTTIKNQLGAVDDFWRTREFDLALGLWEQVLRDQRAAFNGRLLQAVGLEKSGKTENARALLKSLAEDLGTLQKDEELKQALGTALLQARQLQNAVQAAGAADAAVGEMQMRLLSLQRDLGPGGGIAWMQAAVRYRLQQLAKPR